MFLFNERVRNRRLRDGDGLVRSGRVNDLCMRRRRNDLMRLMSVEHGFVRLGPSDVVVYSACCLDRYI